MRNLIPVIAMAFMLSGCVAAPAGDGSDDQPDDDMPAQDAIASTSYANVTGTLTVDPSGAASETGEFNVPPGIARVEFFLSWDDRVAELSLAVSHPTSTQKASAGSGTGLVQATLVEPEPGNWTWAVSGQRAVGTEFQLDIHLKPDANATVLITETYAIAPNTFFEINTIMDANASMAWDWETTDGSALAWNIHTHFDNDVQYIEEETVSTAAGSFTATRDGFHSPMWTNEQSTPVSVKYRFWGSFEVDSYFPPRSD